MLRQCFERQAELIRDLEEFAPQHALTKKIRACRPTESCEDRECTFACYFGRRTNLGRFIFDIAGHQFVGNLPSAAVELRDPGPGAPLGSLEKLAAAAAKARLLLNLGRAEDELGPFLASAIIAPRLDVHPDRGSEWRLVYYMLLSAPSEITGDDRLMRSIAPDERDRATAFYREPDEMVEWPCVAPIPEGEQVSTSYHDDLQAQTFSRLEGSARAEYALWLDATPVDDRLVRHGHQRLPALSDILNKGAQIDLSR
jgi:hypothetical protein